MDLQASPPISQADTTGIKRKRSSSVELPPSTTSATHATHAPPPAKTIKTHSSNPNVNYLSRAYTDTLSLVDQRDSLRSTLDLLSDYVAVMERHESLACNLGAKALGPMLMKRFERLFDERPRILKSNSKDNTSVTWLDVVEFARHKPEQFNLEKQRDGVKVCQFYTRQCRVEISEEDFLLISSGMPQKLIPPQPIPEDEDKELATIEILEKSVAQVALVAEQVQTKIRSFKQRLAGRKNAISNRRLQEMTTETTQAVPEGENPESPASGFLAVNRQTLTNGSTANGKPQVVTAPPAVRAELETLFANIRDGVIEGSPPAVPRPHLNSKTKGKVNLADDLGISNASPVAIPNTPHNLVNHQRPSQIDRYDDSGPFKAEMLSRMEQLNRGDRVMPPCDRCRRLHMDCQKNLTACQGCTRKHAKCSWKEVTDQELVDNPRPLPRDPSIAIPPPPPPQPEGPPQPVRDEELLGEDDSDDENAPVLPKIETAENSAPPSKEESLPPLSSSRFNSSPARDVQIVQQSPEEISARAREILSNRIGDLPAAITSSPGFAPINQQTFNSQVKVHQQLPAIATSLASLKDTGAHHILSSPHHGGSSPVSTTTTSGHDQAHNNNTNNEYRSKWIS